ncbi:hypothetical protein SAMN04488072_105135 [Lentibacillus halodurans]|uniref:Uncharacterized protein n=2 Tax=Lentibacillus halodurans TaxID=237679 RepID=A0A1I0XME2_9BACI|nr:hypothetical protein SAMN04488072_105135 [Lentibacillus halodurans]
MELANQRKQDKSSIEIDKRLEEEDPFGLDEDMEIVLFKCLDCNGTDEVPEYIIGEFSVDKSKGGEVELHCPHCNGTMIRARNIPSD